ncbi:MAG: long-chain fatty acid--CoA ligase [Acidobacteriota bacterium]
METINEYLFGAMQRHADKPMQLAGDRQWTFREVAAATHGVARFLADKGIGKGDRVALIAENSPRWFHIYAGALAVGAVVVPRGEDIGDNELQYILQHSGAGLCFCGTAKTAARIPDGHTVVDMQADDFPAPEAADDAVLQGWREAVGEQDLAVLLYTSGTTGNPKGVMLEHRNIAHNLRTVPPLVNITESYTWVSVLPSWHTFEQTVELCAFTRGCNIAYSSKRRLRDDLKKYRPHYFASVPRIWEQIYDGAVKAIEKKGPVIKNLFWACLKSSDMVRRGNPLGYPLHLLGKKLFYGKVGEILGGRMIYSVSGGGYLPPHIDAFFANLGVKLLIGYGLTETSPVLALRDPVENTLNTIGRPVPETEIKVGSDGTFVVRGPQVMRGYYKEPELTAAVLDADGWFDTGDLGRLTEKNDLVFIGRRKETIVMSGGENVEPEPIEQSILQSPLIQQVMLVGQDRKTLGALVVLDPESDADRDAVAVELRNRTGPAAGFRSFEGVNRFTILEEPFSPENGFLTATLKMRRNVIADGMSAKIDELYA